MSLPLRRGILVAIEGIDGAGKTTQAVQLEEDLRRRGLPVLRTKEPTDGAWGKIIRKWSTSGRPPTAEEELGAFIQDRREHVEEVIAPGLAENRVVVLDRYYFSTAAYQGARGLVPREIIETNEAFAPRPDVTFLLDVSVEAGLRRIELRGNGTNLFERAEALKAVRNVFLDLLEEHMIRIDGEQGVDAIASQIYAHVFDGPLFLATCLKTESLTECEPEHCAYRLGRSCSFVGLGAPEGRVPPPGLGEEMNAIAGDAGLSPEEKIRRIAELAGR